MGEQQRGGEEDDVIGQNGRGGEREGEGSLALIFFPFSPLMLLPPPTTPPGPPWPALIVFGFTFFFVLTILV